MFVDQDVATKRMGSDNSQFSVRFYHKVFGDLIGTVKVRAQLLVFLSVIRLNLFLKGGFSTVTSLTFSPDGKGFCVGSEEGKIRGVFLAGFVFDILFHRNFSSLQTDGGLSDQILARGRCGSHPIA